MERLQILALTRHLLLTALLVTSCRGSSPSKPFILRVRQLDGSIQRIGFSGEEDFSSLTLSDVLKKSPAPAEDECLIQFGTTCIGLSDEGSEGTSQTLEKLGIKHGALLTITRANRETKGLQQKKPSVEDEDAQQRWNPFPDLAKDLQSTKRQIQRRKNSARLSFADLSALRSSLHVVEPQPAGPIHRFHMCQTAAERFFQSSSSSDDVQAPPRVAILFGTLHRERRDPKRVRHKTSLSSTTDKEEYCQVAKVQALWEPPQSPDSKHMYDTTHLADFWQQHPKVMDVAKWLGLVPIGWIFSYPEQRAGGDGTKKKRDDEDALPVFGRDVQTGALLQIANMKQLGRHEGNRFVTVAMHAPTGATEAFQLSDVAVQMVAEDMFVFDGNDDDHGKDDKSSKRKKTGKGKVAKPQRHVSTKHAVLVDGQETKELDSVFCLVNTALLSHQGSFAGDGTKSSGVKKNNPFQLTKKMRKTLAKAVEAAMAADAKEMGSTPEKSELLEVLCNFNVLVALQEDLSKHEAMLLVETVRKFARGQRKGTTLEPKLVKRLQQVLGVV